MGRVINLQGEAHRGLQELLPWFVTGQLDAAEHERVEAHVAGCAECQAEVKFQQRLEAEVAQLPLEVEESWTRMRAQIAAEDERPSWLGNRGAGRARPMASRGGWMGWAAAAAMLPSSRRSRCSAPSRDRAKPWTVRNVPSSTSAASNAPPMPPDAPMTTAEASAGPLMTG